MINLETPKKQAQLIDQAHQLAMNMLRPISRKYDRAEHEYPKELDMLAALIDGVSETGATGGAGAGGVRRDETPDKDPSKVRNGANLASVLSVAEMCWGDTALLLSMPRQGLGNSAIASVANEEQLERYRGTWAAMAITEPGIGSDSANLTTTAVKDGDEYVINGEKIYVTSGDRADSVVVWATLDKELGRAAIKSFLVRKDNPGLKVERLEHKLGIRASDTAAITFTDCRVPAEDLLGSPEIDTKSGFAGAMATFDNTRPLVAAMAVGCARASLDLTRDLLEQAGVTVDYDRPAERQVAAAAKFLQLEADWEGAQLLMMQAAWMADNRLPNSLEASMAKAKAGRVGSDVTLSCVQLCGTLGYSEGELLEKWARDSKILDIFEGTQQIQQLIVARRILGLTSAQVAPPLDADTRGSSLRRTATQLPGALPAQGGARSAKLVRRRTCRGRGGEELVEAGLVEAVDGVAVLLHVAHDLREREGRGGQVEGAEGEEALDPRVGVHEVDRDEHREQCGAEGDRGLGGEGGGVLGGGGECRRHGSTLDRQRRVADLPSYPSGAEYADPTRPVRSGHGRPHDARRVPPSGARRDRLDRRLLGLARRPAGARPGRAR